MNADTRVFRPFVAHSVKNTKYHNLLFDFQRKINERLIQTLTLLGVAIDSYQGPSSWRRHNDYWTADVILKS